MRSGVLLGISFFFTASAFAADAVTVAIPCDKTPFPSCQDTINLLLKGGILPGGTTQKLNGFEALVRQMMDDVYSGKTRTDVGDLQTSTTSTNSCTTIAPVGGPPICPVLRVSENGCADETPNKNYKSEACPKISRVGIVSDGVDGGTTPYYYSLGKLTTGVLETANIAGGMILGISNSASQIRKEITANKLVIGATSGCNAQAVALNTLIAQQNDVKLLEDVATCDVSNTDICSTKKYFQANLGAIDSAYALLVQCRISEEATSKFRAFAYQYPKEIESNVVKPCYNTQKRFDIFDNDAFRRCYLNAYQSWVKRVAKSVFTNVAADCTN